MILVPCATLYTREDSHHPCESGRRQYMSSHSGAHTPCGKVVIVLVTEIYFTSAWLSSLVNMYGQVSFKMVH